MMRYGFDCILQLSRNCELAGVEVFHHLALCRLVLK
jgi:hypothetical protein